MRVEVLRNMTRGAGVVRGSNQVLVTGTVV